MRVHDSLGEKSIECEHRYGLMAILFGLAQGMLVDLESKYKYGLLGG